MCQANLHGGVPELEDTFTFLGSFFEEWHSAHGPDPSWQATCPTAAGSQHSADRRVCASSLLAKSWPESLNGASSHGIPWLSGKAWQWFASGFHETPSGPQFGGVHPDARGLRVQDMSNGQEVSGP